ncbi:cell division protein FtsZ [Tropicimonas sp. IMCC34011]|uniref:cell division protein FtsZ n=1 Tax=Tropicimonas sp. IMCC34011 TaxID=2248759 RepID=UPI000E25B744|nr:cell division protein FtsZ [Tropicimonas sp. IMCC34011]
MTLNLSMHDRSDELKPRITVFGVGGAGGNAVNNMIEKNLQGVEFVTANTDAQALSQSQAAARIQMGVKATEGLGAGARPSVGALAAEETIEEIVDHLAGAHMCFITAGMGGGTGTGAAPIIAQAARELGVLTVGVVTKPFMFEGGKRMRQAEEGVERLQKVVDTLIIIPNQNLFRLANENTTFTEAFALADDVLYQGVKGVTDLMVRPGLINLDFADVRAVMDEMGKAMMGTGEAEGDERAKQAAERAINNPLLDEISMAGAKGVLINITGGEDLTLFELDEAANVIRELVDEEANIIIGSTLDPEMQGKMRVSVVATGIDAVVKSDIPVPRRSLAAPLQQPQQVAEPEYEEVQEQDHYYEEAPRPAPVRAVREEAPAFRAAPRPAPAPAPEQSYDDEEAGGPSLFEGIGDDENGDDGLPAPAYRPAARAPEPAPRREAPRGNADVPGEAFVAPKAGGRGQPSPEAIARLQAAVNKAAPRAAQGTTPRPQPQVQARRPQQASDQPQQAAGDRQRFGIGNLIGRMSGHGHEGGMPQDRGTAATARQQPPMERQQFEQAYEEDEPSTEQEKIEIPAFLRRQAN